MKNYDLLTLINYPKRFFSLFQNSDLEQPVFSKSRNSLILQLETYQLLPFNQYQKLVELSEEKFNCSIEIKIKCQSMKLDHALFGDYLTHVVKNHQLRKILTKTSTQIDGDKVTFLAINSGDYDYINQTLDFVSKELSVYGFTCTCLCEQASIEIDMPQPVLTTTSPKVEKLEYKPKSRSHTKFDDYTKVNISMLQDEMFEVYFEGELFKIESREVKNGRFMVDYYYTDYNDAISTKQYHESMDEVELQIGDWVRLYGEYVFDNYLKENSFRCKKAVRLLHPISYQDNAPEKRLELHAHTKASEMDGICDAKELIKQAYDYGHAAIAITDHGVVHNFPAAQKAAKELNKKDPNKQIKVIYGLEMNVVADEVIMIQSDRSFDLQSESYVIFDLETTGLSSKYDHIIEFGAVKVVNQTVVDQIQFFIKPPVSLPQQIVSLTNITDSMLANEPTLEESFDKVINFIGDSTLVAHNAQFDYRFLQAAAKRLNRPALTNPLIDTLAMAWGLQENRTYFNLGAVARFYGIGYDTKIAHRADYDARILQTVFAHMCGDLSLKGINTSDELKEFQKTVNPINRARPYHVTALVKNQDGIKDLNRLVSLSHTDYLMFRGKSSKKDDESVAEARITKSVINENRSNLLIGSACFNSYLFELARTASQEELEEEMMFYDYIELQPLENYEPLIYLKDILSRDHLLEILKNIYFTAHKLNKLVVATGDVHYVLKHHKIFREVYINAMGIGGAKHPLYIKDEVLRQTQLSPDQHLRTTNEMLEGYPYLSDEETKRIVIYNPHQINDMIDWVYPISSDLYTPTIEGSDQKLTDLVYQNAKSTYGNPLPQIVSDRIEKELHSILSNGFGVIYYTSHLLVKQSLEDGYMVGSRGSVGSSLVATMAEITEVNPLVPHYVCPSCHHSEFFTNNEYASGYDLPIKHCPHCDSEMIGDGQDIPFETFLGFEGDKVPDIDLNFSSDYQEKAHALTKVMFGEDKVLRAGTIGTIAEKTAFGLVSGYFENVVPKEPKHRAFNSYLVSQAAGVKRSTGQHPGGIVVIPAEKDILDFTPYQYPANNPEKAWRTTHYEYHDLEDNLLKLDILGHVDPTAIRFLEDVSGLNAKDIKLNDEKTMSIFSSIDALMIDHRRARDANGAVGLPEFGTQFVRKMLQDTNPKKFSDLVRISGLSHGTDVWLKNAQEIIRSGYTLDDVIACRDDIMTNLSHMGLENKLAFTIMESVRKGRGLKPEWIDAMVSKGVQDWYIQSAQMIKYLFPKAHAVAYCMMGFRVAWFKVHRPLDYYAQYFTLRCTAYEVETMLAGADAIEKRLNDILARQKMFDLEHRVLPKEEKLIDTLEVAFEMCIRGYEFMPVSIDESKADKFWPNPNNPKQLMIPFSAVDGLHLQHAHNIVAQREEREFLSIEDFKKRTNITQNGLSELRKLKVLDHLSESNQLSLF